MLGVEVGDIVYVFEDSGGEEIGDDVVDCVVGVLDSYVEGGFFFSILGGGYC